MEEILEIRDTCKTPLELLNSNAFLKYLNIYKKQFLKELKSRKNSDHKEEVIHKIEFVEKIQPNIFIEILEIDKLLEDEIAKFKEILEHSRPPG